MVIAIYLLVDEDFGRTLPIPGEMVICQQPGRSKKDSDSLYNMVFDNPIRL